MVEELSSNGQVAVSLASTGPELSLGAVPAAVAVASPALLQSQCLLALGRPLPDAPQLIKSLIDPDMVARALPLIMGEGGVVEIRALDAQLEGSRNYDYRATVSGYFDDPAALIRELGQIRSAKGIYVTLNPVLPALLARAVNRLRVCKKSDPTTSDADITCRKWLLVDCDAQRPAGISASDAEHEAAIAKAQSVREALRGEGWPEPVLADSGNGGHLLYCVDLPNDDGGLVRSCLGELATRFTDDKVEIDTAVFNPSRICKLYGTLACKGDEVPDRPYRMAQLLEVPATLQAVPREKLELLAASGPAVKVTRTPVAASAKAAASSLLSMAKPTAGTCRYVKAAVAGEVARVRAAPGGERNCALNRAAFALGQLVGGGVLEEGEARRQLHDAGIAAGLDEGETEKTLNSGLAAGMSQPRGVPDAVRAEGTGAAAVGAACQSQRMPEDEVAADNGATAAPDDAIPILDPKNPCPTVRLFLHRFYAHPDCSTLLNSGGDFWRWGQARGCYESLPEAGVRAAIYEFLERCQRVNRKGVAVDFAPNKTSVDHAIDALRAQTYTPHTAPCWLGNNHENDPDPKYVITLRNAVVDISGNITITPTPRLFNVNALPYGYDPDAPEPEEFLSFLRQLWPDDQESIDTIQDWFGYCLTPDTHLQKMLMLVGPPRSGKGTLARIQTATLGAQNVCNPTLSGLATNFGLSPLVGKLVAIIGDARLSGRTDSAIVVERLLSISGEDAITIDRKNRDPITQRLFARIMCISNELPRLADSSGALASRFIHLILKESFLGREDTGLEQRLLRELPSIFNWSVRGWRRLYARGHFMQPASAAEHIREMGDLASPIGAFVRDRCQVGAGQCVDVSRLYEAYQHWCEGEGREPTTKQTFARDLHAVLPGLTTTQARAGDGRFRMFQGIGLTGWHAMARGPFLLHT